MKLNLIVDRDGVIVGTAPANPKVEGKDAPVSVAVSPAAGRTVHKLDVPKELTALSAADLSRHFRVSLRGKPKVVRTREPAAVKTPAPASAKAAPAMAAAPKSS
jgi:hypothetical protein